MDWIRDTGLNLACDLLGCWCKAKDGVLQPTSDSEWAQAQVDSINLANPIATVGGEIVTYGGRKWLREALDSVLAKGKRYVINPLGELVERSGSAKEYDVIRYGAEVLKSGSGLEAHHGVLDAWFRNRKYPGYSRLDAPAVMLAPYDHQKANRVLLEWARDQFGSADLRKVDWSVVTGDEVMGLTKAMFDAAGVPQRVQDNYLAVFWHYINNLAK